MSDLKPCPFCGGKPDIFTNPSAFLSWMEIDGAPDKMGPTGHYVKCHGECCASTCHYHDKNEAISAWNMRMEPRLTQETARLDEAMKIWGSVRGYPVTRGYLDKLIIERGDK